jgi:hypothetical protein
MSKRMTESRIVWILKEADAGVPLKELCRQHGIADSTFYNGVSTEFGENSTLRKFVWSFHD